MDLKTLIIVVFISLFSICARAQESPLIFSVDEATAFALQHNKTLQNAKQDVRFANMQIKEARGAGLPQVSGTFDYMTNFNYEAELDFGMGGSEPPQIDYTLLDQGDLEVLSLISQMLGPSEPSVIVMEDQANANLQVSQLVFSGQYWVGLKMAKLGKEIYEKNLAISELDVKEQVLSSYYLILVTEELLNILKENERTLKEIYEHTNNMYKAGLAEQTDVDQIKINLSQLENSRRGMERNLKLNYTMFRFVLGIENDTEIQLSDNLQILLEDYEDKPINIGEFDITNNPTYQVLSTQERISQESVAMQKWAYAPTLAAFYSYREKIMTTGFDLSPKNAAGFTLNVPIYSGGTNNARLSQAKIELDKVKRNKALLEEQLSLQDNQLLFEATNALDNYITQKENIDVAKRLYESMNNKYKQGLVSSLELSQANANYLMAENNYYSAVLELLQANLQLDKLYNKL